MKSTLVVVGGVVVDIQRSAVQKLSVVDDLLVAGRHVDDLGVAVNPAHPESSLYPDPGLVLPVPNGDFPVRQPVPEFSFDPGHQLLKLDDGFFSGPNLVTAAGQGNVALISIAP